MLNPEPCSPGNFHWGTLVMFSSGTSDFSPTSEIVDANLSANFLAALHCGGIKGRSCAVGDASHHVKVGADRCRPSSDDVSMSGKEVDANRQLGFVHVHDPVSVP
ncbi:MAG: hypothetical protein ACI8TP_003529 [Acidimicrobiales bacterium]|jgi:hypothetical protein